LGPYISDTPDRLNPLTFVSMADTTAADQGHTDEPAAARLPSSEVIVSPLSHR
jgi:hypothetical protein